LALVVLFLEALASSQPAAPTDDDPFGAVRPATSLSGEDREALAKGETVARTLDAGGPSHFVVFAGARIQTTPLQFVDSMRRIAEIWRGPHVPHTGRFSEAITGEEVASIRLSDQDLTALRRCRPGACDLKLSPAEMALIGQQTAGRTSDWSATARAGFQRVLLERLESYRKGGFSRLGPFHDHDEPVVPQAVFEGLLAEAAVAKHHAPEVVNYLERYPHAALPAGAEEQLYWLETMQTPKPTVQVLHQVIQAGPPRSVGGGGAIEVAVVTRQLFATHYSNGSIATTLLVRADDGQRYLFYINRTAADGLRGWLSSVRRYFIERRVRGAARSAFTVLKRNIETGR
jgi:hypothetical protein